MDVIEPASHAVTDANTLAGLQQPWAAVKLQSICNRLVLSHPSGTPWDLAPHAKRNKSTRSYLTSLSAVRRGLRQDNFRHGFISYDDGKQLNQKICTHNTERFVRLFSGSNLDMRHPFNSRGMRNSWLFLGNILGTSRMIRHENLSDTS